MHFLHNQWSDVNHIRQLLSSDDCPLTLCVLWPVAILFGGHGNINFFFKGIFNWQLLQNHWSSMTLIWYKCCFSKGNVK